MITIKVIQHYVEPLDNIDLKEVEVGNPVTHIYEAENVRYQFFYFNGREQFAKKYRDNIVEGAEISWVFGIPDWWWNGEEDDDIGGDSFLQMVLERNDRPHEIITCANCTIYIMQGGQTVDKIRV